MNKSNADGWVIYRRLIRYALQHKRYLLFAVAGLIVGAITQPAFAWVMEPLLDKSLVGAADAAWVPAAILGIFMVRGIAMFISNYCMTWVGRMVVKELRSAMFEKLLRVPVRFYDTASSGDLLARLTYHVEQVSAASTSGLTILVQDSVTVIGLLALMFWHSWELTLGLLLIGPLIAGIIAWITRRFRNLSHRIQDSVGDVTHVAGELIDGHRVVRIFNGERYEKRRFESANENNRQMHMKRVVTESSSVPLVQFLVAIALAMIIFVATQDDMLEVITPGKFTSFMMAMILLLTPIKRLTQINSVLQNGIAAGESIFKLLDETAEKDSGTKRLERCRGDIIFKHVSFSYTEDKGDVLKTLSFTVKAGEKIALVGRSGSGKTSLVNLLPRFYDYQHGEILLDGVPLTELSLENLRQQFAYVGQTITLFNDTVRNNIAYGHLEHFNQQQIEAAAKAAHALDFIRELPEGMDTLIGDNGVLLSGGQRQRLAIARAILADTPILILDEATSALDTESERYIQTALEELLKQRTTFMIAHRLSTIEKADRIFVMDNGQLVEIGTHQELLTLNGHYARLHRLQFHEQEKTD